MTLPHLDPTVLFAISGAAAVVSASPWRAAGGDVLGRRPEPDVAYRSEDGFVRVYAIFSVDPETHEVHISVVDETGRLIRTIPPESVGEMVRSMGAYPVG